MEKRTYQRPEMKRLGLLRELTKLSWNNPPPFRPN